MGLKSRLTSRKLWLAVGAFITFVAMGDVNQALGVALAYLGVQGYNDSKLNQ